MEYYIAPKEEESYFEVPGAEDIRVIENKTHNWIQFNVACA
jgi:hypothetical protein